MRRHISPVAKQRISDFFTQEDGNVGRKNALMAGTMLSGVMLATTLFGPQTATASDCPDYQYRCGDDYNYDCCSPGQNCCSDWVWEEGKKSYYYFCVDGYCPPQNSG